MLQIGSLVGNVIQSLFKKPDTQLYPFERTAVPSRLRGTLVWNPDKCTGCMLCVKDCPANALELVVLDKKNKKFIMRYHADRCIYCSQCVVSCRMNCLNMTSEQWELASAHKEPFVVEYGVNDEIEKLLLEKAAQPDAESDCQE